MNLRWCQQLMTCFDKGAQAFWAGKALDACPYRDDKAVGNVGRQRAAYWRDGWQQAKDGRVKRE